MIKMKRFRLYLLFFILMLWIVAFFDFILSDFSKDDFRFIISKTVLVVLVVVMLSFSGMFDKK